MGLIDKFKGNCALVAVRDLTQMPDDDIVLAFLHEGWLPNQGTYEHTLKRVLSRLGVSFTQISVPKSETSNCRGARAYGNTNYFRWNNPHGTFLMLTPTHAFVMRDGVIVDPNMRKERLKARITGAYEIHNAKQSKIVQNQHDELKALF